MAPQLIQPDSLVLDHAITDGIQIETANGLITAIHSDRSADARAVRGTLLPGFVDLQVNGAGGCSVQDATPDALDQVAQTVAEYGAIAFLPTLITAPFGQLLEQVQALANWIEARADRDAHGSAEALGIHVEGPFLVTAGAHAATELLDPTPQRITQLLAAGRGHIRMVTLAPSRAGAPAAVAQLVKAGVCVSLGHGTGSTGIDECVAAGATMVTHLFNAMGPWNHRDPGMVGTVLDQEALTCGLIVDRIHVHPTWVRLAARCLGTERLVLVTDCISAMGMPDGKYKLADMDVTLSNGTVRNRDGTLAGSALTMFQAGEDYLRITPTADAAGLAQVAATNPAKLIGAADRFGSLAVGQPARFTLLQPDGTLSRFDSKESGSQR